MHVGRWHMHVGHWHMHIGHWHMHVACCHSHILIVILTLITPHISKTLPKTFATTIFCVHFFYTHNNNIFVYKPYSGIRRYTLTILLYQMHFIVSIRNIPFQKYGSFNVFCKKIPFSTLGTVASKLIVYEIHYYTAFILIIIMTASTMHKTERSKD